MSKPIKWKGQEIPIWAFFPVFVFHITLFGFTSFLFAYFIPAVPTIFLWGFGFIGIVTFIGFYSSLYGVDNFRWIIINIALGIFGLSSDINLLMSILSTDLTDFPWYRDIIPFTNYVLYTFWFRQCALAAVGAKDNPEKEEIVSYYYLITSIFFYASLYFF